MAYKYKFAGVYKIENIRNGNIYIGSTGHFYHRKDQHLHDLRSGNHYITDLQKDFNGFGEMFFKFVLLESMPNATKEELITKEQEYIDKLNPEYNKSESSRYGKYEFTDEIKSKISGKTKQLWTDPEYRAKHCKPRNWKNGIPNRTGVKLSDETKEKIRQANLGSKNPHYGKPRSEKFLLKVRKIYPGLVSPNGEIFAPIVGLNEFCRQHNLDSGQTSRLMSGKIKSYKGWKLTLLPWFK